MIRWTERPEGYIVRASRSGTTLRAVMGVLSLAAGLLAMANDDFELLLYGAVPGIGLMLWAWRDWTSRPWLFIPVHGKGAIWGRGEADLAGSPAQVDRFDLERVPRRLRILAPNYLVVGILAGGQRVDVLGPWRSADALTVEGVVKQLNDLLQATDRSLAMVKAPEMIDEYRAAAQRHLSVLVVFGLLILGFVVFLSFMRSW